MGLSENEVATKPNGLSCLLIYLAISCHLGRIEPETHVQTKPNVMFFGIYLIYPLRSPHAVFLCSATSSPNGEFLVFLGTFYLSMNLPVNPSFIVFLIVKSC